MKRKKDERSEIKKKKRTMKQMSLQINFPRI